MVYVSLMEWSEKEQKLKAKKARKYQYECQQQLVTPH